MLLLVSSKSRNPLKHKTRAMGSLNVLSHLQRGDLAASLTGLPPPLRSPQTQLTSCHVMTALTSNQYWCKKNKTIWREYVCFSGGLYILYFADGLHILYISGGLYILCFSGGLYIFQVCYIFHSNN